MAPWGDGVEEVFEVKKASYSEMMEETARQGWIAQLRPVKVGCRGFVDKSTMIWVLGGRTSGIQLKTCPCKQNE